MKRRLSALLLAILLAFTFVSCAEPETPRFTVSFEGIEHDPVVVALGEKFKLPEDLPAKEGYQLIVKMGDTVLDAGKEYEITADTVLKCSYEKYKWTITVDGEKTQIADGYKYEILKSKEGYLATSVKVDGAAFDGESIVITKDIKIDYEWAKAWTLTVDGKSEMVVDGHEYKIQKTQDGYVLKSVKVNGVETDLDTVVIDKDTRIEYVWTPAYTVTYTGTINETVKVPEGESYRIPADIRKTHSIEVLDNQAFIITVDGIQYFPGDVIELDGDIEISASIMEGTKGLVIHVMNEEGNPSVVVGFDPNQLDESFDGTLVIPEKFAGSPVVKIMQDAFLQIPLNPVYLPEGLVDIGTQAFAANTELRYIAFPSSLKVIEPFAFAYSGLRNVGFNEGLEEISNLAFAFTNFDKVEIPEGVHTIGDGAFGGNSKLVYVSIPSTVDTMGEYVFLDCDSLRFIDVARNQADCTTWPEGWSGAAEPLYSDMERKTVTVSFAGEGISIPSQTVELGKLVTLPKLPAREGYRLVYVTENGVEYIPGHSYGFAEDTRIICQWLKQWTLNVNGMVETVDDGHVFEIPASIGDASVKYVKVNGEDYAGDSIEIHEDVTITWELVQKRKVVVSFLCNEGGVELLNETREVKEGDSVELPAIKGYYVGSVKDAKGVEYHPLMQIVADDDMSFTYTGLKKETKGLQLTNNGHVTGYNGEDVDVVIPDVTEAGIVVRELDVSCFEGKSNITSVVIPNGVSKIGYGAFDGCWQLESVALPRSLKALKGRTFMSCHALKHIELPDGLESMDNEVFEFSGLESIELPDSLTRIGQAAFSDTSLVSLEIPAGMTSLFGDIVNNCTKLTSLTVSPNNNAFKSEGNNIYSKDGKTLVVGTVTKGYIPDGIVNIGNYACRGCLQTELIMPDSVENIGEGAFSHNVGLEKVTLSRNLKTIGDYAFNLDKHLKEITLPEGLESIGRWALRCESLDHIEIPSSVTYVDHAFLDCTNLTSITVRKNKEDCTSWHSNWHGATDAKHVTVTYNDCTVIYPETSAQN